MQLSFFVLLFFFFSQRTFYVSNEWLLPTCCHQNTWEHWLHPLITLNYRLILELRKFRDLLKMTEEAHIELWSKFKSSQLHGVLKLVCHIKLFIRFAGFQKFIYALQMHCLGKCPMCWFVVVTRKLNLTYCSNQILK